MCPQRQDLSAVEPQFQRNDYQVSNYDGYHCFVCQLFGNPTLPSRMIFDDLICETKFQFSEVMRPGVTINRRRCVAEDKKLYFLETSPMNTDLVFEGEISFLPECSEAGKILILAALKQISALGGSKSTGLGWLRWETGDLDLAEEAWKKLVLNQDKI
jgi:CRISPR/Cas system CSM-associated protein Csm3 (group 7 of RAMP superfamily)